MRPSVIRGLGCALASVPLAAHAAGTPSVADTAQRAGTLAAVAADSATVRPFAIPAQPLADALADLSRQAGVRVTVDGGSLAGLRSTGATGRMPVAEAVRRVLAGSGLAARFTDAQTVAVLREGEGPRPAQTLGRVVVTGSATRPRGYAAAYSTSATRTDTPLRDVPQSVTVVTRDLIADQAMQGMGDVVRYVPGITMALGEGHRDAPTIRGNSTTADFFVDGVRDDAQYLRDLYNVERVEALKGANAMAFGRGGGGGVLNRVGKEAQWAPTRSLSVTGGSFEQRRGTIDVGQGLGRTVAARLNGMVERSGGFRDAARLARVGINPTLALTAGARTMVRLGYELLDDGRRVDRGIPSFQGRPSGAGVATFFGNPTYNDSDVRVHAANALVEHSTAAGVVVRNRTRWASYDKFYANTFPGAVNAAGTQVSLSAYSNATDRTNLFNQTDLTYGVATGAVQHTLLAGAELGRQATANFRQTGYFNSTSTSLAVPFDAPTIATPVAFRQSASDADNAATARVAAVYVQDQIALSAQWQAIVGVRYERFGVDFHDRRTDRRLQRTDVLLSPRAGLVFKPVQPVSFYGGYSVSYLPSAGDQFSSLTATSQTLKPEQFRNAEVGAKWDVRPALSLTTAAYRLDRTNTSAPDPADATRLVQTGSQRTTGLELGLSGRPLPAWEIAGGYATQRATITSTTSAAKAGARVPLVPAHTLSLWNKVQVARPLGLGVGVVRQTDMFAAIDNAVTLPGFTRLDAGVFLTLVRDVRAQLNVENLLDARYFASSHGNNNIMPGASRTLRLSLTTGF